MEIKILGGAGLHKSELNAISLIENGFRSSWKGYAGIVLADNQGSMEIDLLIVTHDRVLVVELKEWNGELTSSEGKWYVNKQCRGKSPYDIKRTHAQRIRNLLAAELKYKLRGYSPHVEAHVVLCGSCTKENLTTSEKEYTHNLQDFLDLSSKYDHFVQKVPNIDGIFTKYNYDRPNTENSKKVFDEFFLGKKVKALDYEYHDYQAKKESDYIHPKKLFEEFESFHKETKDIAILRRWDFDQLGNKYASQDLWSEIILREHRLKSYVEGLNEKLGNYFFDPLVVIKRDDILNDTSELYKIRKTEKRIGGIVKDFESYSIEKRYDIVRALLKPISELHNIDISHRDFGIHNVYYSKVSDRIIFSQFFSAYFKEKGTISDYRDILKTNTINLPEDVYDDKKDPFRMDVFLLGVICYFILSKGNILKTDTDGIPVFIEDENINEKVSEWLKKSLSFDSSERFENADLMLQEFNKVTSINLESGFNYLYNQLQKGNFLNNKSFKELYTLSIINSIEDENNKESANYSRFKIDYLGKTCVVKWWNPMYVDENNLADCRRILEFKKKIDKIKSSNISTLNYVEYGYIGSNSILYQIYEYINGKTLDEYLGDENNIESKKIVAKKLINNIINLHQLGIYHGDLHNENIIISDDECYLIDIADISFGSEKYNNEFSPINPTTTDGFGRDIYATYKIVEKIFENTAFEELEKEISLAYELSNGIPVSLDPLLNVLTEEKIIIDGNNTYISTVGSVEVFVGNRINPENLTMESIDGKFLFNFRENKEFSSKIDCYITGLNTYLKVVVDVEERCIDKLFANPASFSDVVSAESKKSEDLLCDFNFSKGDVKSNNQLLEIILNLNSVIDYLEEKYSIDDSIIEEIIPDKYIPISKIWTTLAETEEEVRESVIITSNKINENKDGNYVFEYFAENESALDFEYDEIVRIYNKEGISIGELVIADTNLDYLTINLFRKFNINNFSVGDVLFLESIRNKASRDRRLKALNRVINNNSVIRDIPAYFDINSDINIANQKIDLNLDNLNSKLIDINEGMSLEQIDNFKKIIEVSPISVLQGPPGTGKTSFISKFVYFLFSEMDVKNVLLVSQSHTAVDNVVSRTKQLSDKLGNDLNIVRLGQEAMIDSEILPYSTSSIQRQILSKFDREYEQRILSLANYISLPRNFILELIRLYQFVGPILIIVDRLKLELTSEKSKGNRQEYIIDIENKIQDKIKIIQSILHSKYKHNFELSLNSNHLDEIISYFCNEFSINNIAELKKLKSLLKISDDWLSVLRSGDANFDKFLVKSKQLVCGTLVGIGKNNIQIENVEFDWVIIDEAARAQASELMIAMQSGKRILLVGDHKQLPPHYNKKHIKLAAKKLNENTNIFEVHDFEKAFNKTKGITLSTQYRMVEPICKIISEVFYPEIKGGLQTGRPKSPEWYDELQGTMRKSVVWLDSSADQYNEVALNPGYYNEAEVNLIKNSLQSIVNTSDFLKKIIEDQRENSHPIGIITLYKAQKDKVESMISQTDWLQPIRELIKIDTVDSYQGQQNSIIILSLVRDNAKFSQGFLQHPERINVALSRAQERLIIIGARNMWSKCSEESPLNKVLNVIEKYAVNEAENFEIIENF